jgi:signal peptidase I
MTERKRDLTQQWLKLLDGSLQSGATIELPVLSDSMLPVFGMGRHIKIQRVPWNTCAAGDIIVFRENRRLTAHRLLFVVRTGRRCYFYQKGDANAFGHFIRAERVVGRVVEYQDETGSYRNLSSIAARRAKRVEALRQLLRVVWGYARRLLGKETINA